MSFIKIVFLIIILSTSLFAEDKCHLVKATFDIGSASTKMIVASIDICEKKVLKQLLSKNIHIPFKSELAKSSDGNFSRSLVITAISEIKKLKQLALNKNATTFDAVATASFRQAENGETVASEINDATGVNFRVITQDEEARIGYKAALLKIKDSNNPKLLVWDIGGGSMQMTSFNSKEKQWSIFKGKLASVSFRNVVISKLQKKSIESTHSPNPLGSMALVAVNFVKRAAEKNVNRGIKKIAREGEVYGIGGVHYYSIRKQCDIEQSYSQIDLEICLDKRKLLTDKEVGGKYATTDITNIALVLGYMKALNIKKVTPIKANMSYGQFFN